MKTIFKSLLFLLVLVSFSFSQGVLSANASGYAWATSAPTPTTITTDTVSGTSDSVILVQSLTYQKGVMYVFSKNTFTGVDSVKIQCRLDVYNAAGTFMRSVVFDTITTQASEAIILPINRTEVDGTFYRVMGKAIANNGSTSIYKGGNIFSLAPAIPEPNRKFNNVSK